MCVNGRYTPPASSGLSAFTSQDPNASGRQLTTGLRDLYRQMSVTPESYNPVMFLQVQTLLFRNWLKLMIDPAYGVSSIRTKKS